MVCSTVGSPTCTGWKRRSSAASFSMYLRYSSSVVAPIVCSSPRASFGLRIDAASIAPSAHPPTARRGQLVDEQDDVAAGVDLLEHLLQALLEVTAVAAAGHQRTEVEGVQLLVFQGLGNLAVHDRLREAFHDRRLTDAGLTDQHRVVLGASRQHLHDPLDFLLAADDRVELAFHRSRRQVAAELVEPSRSRRAAGLATTASGTGLRGLLALVAAQQLDHLLAHPGQLGAQLDQHLGGNALTLTDQTEQNVLGADVVVAELKRLAQAQLQNLLGARGERDVTGRSLLALADDLLDLAADTLQRDAQ